MTESISAAVAPESLPPIEILAEGETAEPAVPTECPLSHRVARRFFTSVIVALVVLLAASLILVFVIQR